MNSSGYLYTKIGKLVKEINPQNEKTSTSTWDFQLRKKIVFTKLCTLQNESPLSPPYIFVQHEKNRKKKFEIELANEKCMYLQPASN